MLLLLRVAQHIALWDRSTQIMSKVTVRQGLISVAVFPFQPYMGEGEESLEGCSSNLQAFLSNTQLHLTTEARGSLMAETLLFYYC